MTSKGYPRGGSTDAPWKAASALSVFKKLERDCEGGAAYGEMSSQFAGFVPTKIFRVIQVVFPDVAATALWKKITNTASA